MISYAILFWVGLFCGLVGLPTLHRRLGWVRIAALAVVWALAAGSRMYVLPPPPYQVGTGRVEDPMEHYLPVAVQLMVACCLVAAYLGERRRAYQR